MTAQLRLPAEKLAQLIADLYSWCNRRSCTKRQLLSLIGSLSHASRVIRPGRTFLRRLIDLSTTVSEPHDHIRLPELTLRGGSLLLSAGMAPLCLLCLLHPSTSTLTPPGHGALELSGRLTGSKLSGPITGFPSI